MGADIVVRLGTANTGPRCIASSFAGTLNYGIIRVEIIFLPVVETLAAIYIDARKSLAASIEIFANNNTSVNRAIN